MECNSEPFDTVVDSDSLIIYSAREADNKKCGNFVYSVRDGSSSGWRLITDKKFKVGDVLIITKKEIKE